MYTWWLESTIMSHIMSVLDLFIVNMTVYILPWSRVKHSFLKLNIARRLGAILCFHFWKTKEFTFYPFCRTLCLYFFSLSSFFFQIFSFPFFSLCLYSSTMKRVNWFFLYFITSNIEFPMSNVYFPFQKLLQFQVINWWETFFYFLNIFILLHFKFDNLNVIKFTNVNVLSKIYYKRKLKKHVSTWRVTV